jgi:hypothetical protein
VGVEAEGEARVAVAEVLGELLDVDAVRQGNTRVVVPECMLPGLAVGEVVEAPRAFLVGCGMTPAWAKAGYQMPAL